MQLKPRFSVQEPSDPPATMPSLDAIPVEIRTRFLHAEVVSFDVFDTLLERPCERPADLFTHIAAEISELLGRPIHDFRSERVQAERAARDRARAAGEEREVSIDEIYDALAERVGLHASERDLLLELELRAELDVLRPRPEGRVLYELACALGKRVIVVSDVYLPHAFVASALREAGYDAHERVYVSSETGKQKHTGRLFEHVVTELGVDPSSVLHVGDNDHADIRRAREHGLETLHLRRVTERFSLTPVYQRLWARDEAEHTYSWRSVLATIAKGTSNDLGEGVPSASLFGGDPYRLGFAAFGPLLLGFSKWLIETAKRAGCESLYFLARDGKVLLDAYRIVARAYDAPPAAHYLLCSRRAAQVATMRTEDDVRDRLDRWLSPASPAEIVEGRLGLSMDDVPDAIWARHGLSPRVPLRASELGRVADLATDLAPLALANAARERGAYLAYLANIGLRGEVSSAVVDIGHGGTMQRALDSLLTGSRRLGGFYVATSNAAHETVRQGLRARGYLCELLDTNDPEHPFSGRIVLFETLFGSPETSLLYMEPGGPAGFRPVFRAPDRGDARRAEVISEIQRGALAFVERFTEGWGKRLPRVELEPKRTVAALRRFFHRPDPDDARLFQGLPFDNAFTGAATRWIIPDDDRLATDPCVWEAGRAALLYEDRRRFRDLLSLGRYEILPFVMTRLGKAAGPLIADLVHLWATRFLNERLARKFRKNPSLFFADARSPFLRSIGHVYLVHRPSEDA